MDDCLSNIQSAHLRRISFFFSDDQRLSNIQSISLGRICFLFSWLLNVSVTYRVHLWDGSVSIHSRLLNVSVTYRVYPRGGSLVLFFSRLLDVSITSRAYSGAVLHREMHVLPHGDRICRSTLLHHLVTCILTPCQPVRTLTLYYKARGGTATRVHIFKTLV